MRKHFSNNNPLGSGQFNYTSNHNETREERELDLILSSCVENFRDFSLVTFLEPSSFISLRKIFLPSFFSSCIVCLLLLFCAALAEEEKWEPFHNSTATVTFRSNRNCHTVWIHVLCPNELFKLKVAPRKTRKQQQEEFNPFKPTSQNFNK